MSLSDSQDPYAPEPKLSIARYVKFTIIFAGIIFGTLGMYEYWNGNYGTAAREEREKEENFTKFTNASNNFAEAEKADIYGGKTAQETINLFVDALRKEDINLAAKYFALNTNPNDPNYLTRKEWEDALRKAKADNRLSKIAEVVSRAVRNKEDETGEDDFKFTTHSKDGALEAFIDMQFNAYSSIWKIESIN